jgi:hypothetical protein
MDVTEFTRLLAERDNEVGVGPDDDWHSYAGPQPAIDMLYNNKPVKLFNGSVVKKLESIRYFNANSSGEDVSDDSWYSDYGSADGEEFVVSLDVDGDWSYFKITGYYDSWDNGLNDVFKVSNIVKVEKVQISKHEWKEVE